jgi:hypothetical protein
MKKLVMMLVVVILVTFCFVSISMAQVARIYEKIVPGNTITGFTATNLQPTTGPLAGKRANKAMVYVKNNAINYDITGSVVITQSGGTDVGMYAGSGTTLIITGNHDLQTFRCIDATAGSASDLRVTYFFEN